MKDFSAGTTIYLYNLSGLPVYTAVPDNNGMVEIDRTLLEKGMYLVKIRDGMKTYNEKIIIQ
jgi:hypothetical protein